MPHLTRVSSWFALSALCSIAACGSSSTDGTSGIKDDITGGAAGSTGFVPTGSGGSFVANPSDASAPFTGGDGSLVGVVGVDDLGDASCAEQSIQAERRPLDIYIMLDSSGSMTNTLADKKTTKWSAVSSAIKSFLSDPSSAGLGVGLQYFPLVAAGIPPSCETTAECLQSGPCGINQACTITDKLVPCATNADCSGIKRSVCARLGTCATTGGICNFLGDVCAGAGNDNVCVPIAGYCGGRDSCRSTDYAAPAVEIAPLPGAATALLASLAKKMPDGLTPTSSALSGALAHAQAVALANPTHRVVVLFATDGTPTECEPIEIADVSKIASTALAGAPPISTFVVGVFAPDEQAAAQKSLDSLAAAGGTNSAFIVNTNQDVSKGVLDALNAIRTTALACEYSIPIPEGGQPNYLAVNVRFTSGAGKRTTLGYVESAAACGAKGGWYYDNDPRGPKAPTKIEVCATTCTSLKADTQGKVDIVLGCQTQTFVN